MRSSRVILALIVILALSIALRSYGIGEEGLWSDEFYSVETAMQPSDIAVAQNVDRYEINPPAYFIALRRWMEWFGNSEAALRSLSLIFGVLNVLLVYMLGAELISRKGGVIAALLMATSVVHVEFSQEARAYMMFTFFFLLSSYLFVKALKTKNVWVLAWLAAVNTAGMLVHYIMAYLVFLENIIVLLFLYKDMKIVKRWLLAQLLTVILFLPWLPFFLSQMSRWMVKWRGTLVGEFGLPASIGNLGALIFALPLIIGAVAFALLLFLVYTRKIDLIKIAKRHMPSKGWMDTGFIAFSIIIAAAYLILLPHIMTPSFLNKFTLPFTAFLYLIFVLGIERLASRRTAAAILVMLLCINAFGLYSYYNADRKEDIRGAMQYVGSSIQPGDALLLCEGDLWYSIDYYTSVQNKRYMLYTPQDEQLRRKAFDAIEPKIAGKNVWYVKTHCRKEKNSYTGRLEEIYSSKQTVKFKGVEVMLFSP